MRLSTLPTAFGEKMVMRIFDPDTTVKNLDALGFSQHDAERWEQLVKRPYGIVLVTGPTGSGKTTTLYSCLLYTSDAADDLLCVDLGGRRIIKKKKKQKN